MDSSYRVPTPILSLCLLAGAAVVVTGSAGAISSWLWRKKITPVEVESLVIDLGDVTEDNINAEDEIGDGEQVDGDDGFFGNLFREDRDTEYGRVARRTRTTRYRVKMVARVAIELKVKFGLVRDTEANHLMMSDHARKYMVEHGVRPSHITQIYPVAVRMALIPSEDEVLGAQMAGTRRAQERVDDAFSQWETRPWYLRMLPGDGGRRIGLRNTGA